MRRDKILRMVFDLSGGVEVFDYPDYGGMPREIFSTFSPEIVDAIQDNWNDRYVVGKKAWVKQVLKRANELGDEASLYADIKWTPPKKKAGGNLKHCTDCGHMFSTGEVCPTCGGTNVRPNVGEGTRIMMTVYCNH